MQKNVLVTGGAGYVGSHTCKALKDAGYTPVTFDNLSNGHQWAIKFGPFFQGDILDPDALDAVFEKYSPIGVLHFAALIEVGVSVKDPSSFWETNVMGALNVLNACRKHNVKSFVFSSTCAIFGETEEALTEQHSVQPLSPYAKSKATVEEILKDFDVAYDLKSTALRYFNAAGADFEAGLGEAHNPESHLIPLACLTALGKRDKMYLFGDDYNTPDGTCIRDYVHVSDLADAHVLAFNRLLQGGNSRNFNLGTGEGASVKEILQGVKEVSDIDFPVQIEPRRAGDCPRLVGDNTRAKQELGWSPKFLTAKQTIQTAWNWHKTRCPN